jgi:hypothetical protein
LATTEGQSQEETMVTKPSPVPAKKKPTAPPSKRQKRGTSVATSLEVHQPSASSDNVSGTVYTPPFWFLSFLRFSYNLCSAGFDAEVSFSWC